MLKKMTITIENTIPTKYYPVAHLHCYVAGHEFWFIIFTYGITYKLFIREDFVNSKRDEDLKSWSDTFGKKRRIKIEEKLISMYKRNGSYKRMDEELQA